MNKLMLVGAVLLSMTATAQAQRLIIPPKGYCVYESLFYSPGSYRCVGEGKAITCGTDGHWVAENAPACKGPNDPPPK